MQARSRSTRFGRHGWRRRNRPGDRWMRSTVFAIGTAAFGLSYSVVAAPPPLDAQNRVEIYHRFIGPACAGLCIDEDITVSSYGRISWQVISPDRLAVSKGEREFAPGGASPGPVHNFLVPKERAQKFIAMMRPIKRSYDGVWKSAYCEWSIRFSDQSESDSHITCSDDPNTLSIYREATDIIGMHNGFFVPSEKFVRRLSD